MQGMAWILNYDIGGTESYSMSIRDMGMLKDPCHKEIDNVWKDVLRKV